MSQRLVAFSTFEDLTHPRIARTSAHGLFDVVVDTLASSGVAAVLGEATQPTRVLAWLITVKRWSTEHTP